MQTDRAQDTEAIRAALQRAYVEADDRHRAVRVTKALDAFDRLVARLEAAERERNAYREALDTIDWLLLEDRLNADPQIAARLTRGETIKRDVIELARAALAAAAPGGTEQTP